MAQGLSLADQPKLDSPFTNGRFSGETVIVTGGGGGIGSAIVHRFVNDGARVAILDINITSASEKFFQEIADGKVRCFDVDVTDRDLCHTTVKGIHQEMGPVRHLVNCVAYFGSQSLKSTRTDWDLTMSVNVMGSAFMAQAVVQVMKDQKGNNMSITNMSSISAHQTQPNRWTYAASKGAVNILTKNMALDLAEWGIRVNSVSPGWIWSPEVSKAAGGDRGKWEPVWGRFHISGRLGEQSEVAGAVTFLASRDAAFVNATDLKVDGGYGAMSAEGLGGDSSFAGCDD